MSARIGLAAAVLFLGSVIALALGIFAFSLTDADRTVSIVAVVIGAWGIVTGIGLLRLWRWARISALIVGGFYAYVGFALTPMIPFFQIPVPPDLRDQITTEAATEAEMRIKIVLILVFLLFARCLFNSSSNYRTYLFCELSSVISDSWQGNNVNSSQIPSVPRILRSFGGKRSD